MPKRQDVGVRSQSIGDQGKTPTTTIAGYGIRNGMLMMFLKRLVS